MDELRILKASPFPKPLNEIWENKARTLTGPTPSFPTLKFQVTEAPGAMGEPGVPPAWGWALLSCLLLSEAPSSGAGSLTGHVNLRGKKTGLPPETHPEEQGRTH